MKKKKLQSLYIPQSLRDKGVKTRQDVIEYYGFTSDEIYGEVRNAETD